MGIETTTQTPEYDDAKQFDCWYVIESGSKSNFDSIDLRVDLNDYLWDIFDNFLFHFVLTFVVVASFAPYEHQIQPTQTNDTSNWIDCLSETNKKKKRKIFRKNRTVRRKIEQVIGHKHMHFCVCVCTSSGCLHCVQLYGERGAHTLQVISQECILQLDPMYKILSGHLYSIFSIDNCFFMTARSYAWFLVEICWTLHCLH